MEKVRLIRISGGPDDYVFREYDFKEELRGRFEFVKPEIIDTHNFTKAEAKKLSEEGLIPEMLYYSMDMDLLESDDFYIYAYLKDGRYEAVLLEESEDGRTLKGRIGLNSDVLAHWLNAFVFGVIMGIIIYFVKRFL